MSTHGEIYRYTKCNCCIEATMLSAEGKEEFRKSEGKEEFRK